MPGTFLTARWLSLVLLNYSCPAALLAPLVPRGTELDRWDGEPVVSLVGFLFSDTRLLGVPVPGHRTFEEVNLRFYVRRTTADGERRRAVVFVRELVPRRAIAAVARLVYNEPYLAVPMWHDIALDALEGGGVHYGWRHGAADYGLSATVAGAARPLVTGSEAEFITEHYWGYTRQRDGGTLEYQVEHPPWTVWTAAQASFTGPAAGLYGDAFATVLSVPPRSAFVATGSAVTVRVGRRIA
ncbi:MAG: YqjF family protein [Vicinamibacterales bacterium]